MVPTTEPGISLESSDREWERFFRLSSDLIGVLAHDGEFLRLNPAWERAIGFTAGELLSKSYLALVHPDDSSAASAALARLGEQGEGWSFENRLRSKDGSYRWICWSSRVAREDGSFFVIARDVT